MIDILIVIAIVLISTVLHELAHGYVAYFLGDKTAKYEGRLSLNPLKHIDPYLSIMVPVVLYLTSRTIFGGAKPVPVDSRNLKHGVWGMAMVAAAGPITNFLLALLAFLIMYGTGLAYSYNIMRMVLAEIVMVNLGFCVFNLIPIPPLDGSRILYAIAPDGVRGLMEQVEQYGIMVVMVLVVFAGGFFAKYMSMATNAILGLFYFMIGK